jgi:hypothetical protein
VAATDPATPLQIAQLVTSVTGLVGAVGGASIAYLTLRKSMSDDKLTVKVTTAKSFLVGVKGVDDKNKLTIGIANLGKVPFTVASIGWKVGRNTNEIFLPQPDGTHPLGTVLDRDKTCTFWTDYDKVIADLKKETWRSHIKVRAYVRDYAGHFFVSDWLDVRMKETRWFKAKIKVRKAWRAVKRFFIP